MRMVRSSLFPVLVFRQLQKLLLFWESWEQMARAEKIIDGMRNNPRDWRIDDLKAVSDRYGIAYRQHGTSHVSFRDARGNMLSVPAARPVKPVYVRQFVALIAQQEERNE